MIHSEPLRGGDAWGSLDTDLTVCCHLAALQSAKGSTKVDSDSDPA